MSASRIFESAIPSRNVVGVKDDSGCYDRACQRPTPGLIHAGNRPAVDLKLDCFQLEGRLHGANRLPLFEQASRYQAVLSKEPNGSFGVAHHPFKTGRCRWRMREYSHAR